MEIKLDKKKQQPQFYLFVLVEHYDKAGEIQSYEWIAIDNSDNFVEGTIEYHILEIMSDLYVTYMEYKNLGSVFRVVRNNNYKMERYN